MAPPRLHTLKPRLKAMGNRLATMQPGSWRNDKQTSGERGYNYRWQKARLAFLRTHPLCKYCLRKGIRTTATVVDHVVPHRGDMLAFWNESNWQSLCATHHSRDKQREEALQP